MPAIHAITVTAIPGKEDAVAQDWIALGEILAKAPGFKGRHVLQALPPGPPPPGLHEGRPEGGHGGPPGGHGDEGVHFIITEIWETPEDQQAFMASEAFRGWYGPFTKSGNLLPAHTHNLYKDVAGH